MTGRHLRVVFLVLFIFLLFAVSKAVGIYVDWLFFTEVGLRAVFTRALSAEVLTGFAFGVAFFVFVGLNVLFASGGTMPPIDIVFMQRMRIAVDPGRFMAVLKPMGLAIAFCGGIVAALWGSGLWTEALTFANYVQSGTIDPIFGHDISFYLFRLPLWESLNGYVGFLLVFTALIVAALYAMRGGVVGLGRSISLSGRARTHLAVLVMLFFVKLAFGFFLERFDSLYASHSVITGAGYADVYGRIVVLGALVPLTVLGGILFVYGLWRGRWRLALFPSAFLIVLYIVGAGIYPAFLQNFKVAPSELALEEPFIKHHIDLTRYGYNLNKVQVMPFDVSFNLTTKDIRNNDATIKNIRLWDETPLLKTYSQLQQIRTYYRFHGIDNDRYTIGGEYRQVMLSARELSYDDLPSRSWINEKLVFTHGNGVVMGYASRISKEGLPEFIIKDIPPVSTANVKITLPEIYYGELTNDYVIVNTKVPEFSYPTAEGNVYTSYKGSGGVRLDTLWKRAFLRPISRQQRFPLRTRSGAKAASFITGTLLERVKGSPLSAL